MWIERRKLNFLPFEVKAKGNEHIIKAPIKPLKISKTQYEYLKLFQQGESIHQLVLDLVKKGWLVSFTEMYDLLDLLTTHNLILNPEISSFFNMARGGLNSTGLTELEHHKGHVVANPEMIKSLPFFRTLHPDLLKLFLKNATAKTVVGNTRLCIAGEKSRELFALLEGAAGVYKTYPDGRRQLISVIPQGSIFGEGGFLLNRSRGADVITLQESTVAVINHSQDFESMINSGKAEVLQQRFWVLQGLMNSELFSHIPAETLDSLVFSGTLINVKKDEIVTKEGEIGRSFFVIIQGSIAFTKKGNPLRSLGQGEIFGEVALMVSGGTRTATAVALKDSLLLEIKMQEFYELLSNHLILGKEIEKIAWHRWNQK